MNKRSVVMACLGLSVGILAGCATQRIDWKARVGRYTYDQAVTDYGPPDQLAKTADGRVVVDWVTHYANGGGMFYGAGYYGIPGTVGLVQTPPVDSENTLRLTFGSDHVLTAWSKH